MGRLFPPYIGGLPAVGFLAVRVVSGAAMMLHGLPKIKNPMGWMGPDAPVPGLAQAAAAVAEFGGGICWIVGAVTPIASLLIMATMAVAVTTFHLKAGHPFVNVGGPSFELATDYFAVGLLLLLAGPGKLSIDAIVFGGKSAGSPPTS